MDNKYKTSKYWLDRQSMEQEAIKKYIEQDKQAIASLGRHYDVMLNNINNLIDAEISKLASRNNVGIELTRQQVSKMDVSAYQDKAKDIVQKAAQMRKKGHRVTYGDYPEAVNRELRIYNATMRINRLELLKANIGLEISRASMGVATETQSTLVDRYISEVKRQAGILGINSKNDQLLNNAAIQGVVNADLNGATWSTRLWANQVGIRANLEQVLSTGLAHFDTKKMHALMQSSVNNWKYVASRLLNTEISRVLVAAQWSSIKKAGYNYVKWIAEPKACSICSGIAHIPSKEGIGVFEIDKVPSIPAQTHPNCRCSISAFWVEEKKSFEFLDLSKNNKHTLKELGYRFDDATQDYFNRTGIDVKKAIKQGNFSDRDNPYDDIKAGFIKYLAQRQGFDAKPKKVKKFASHPEINKIVLSPDEVNAPTTFYRGVRPTKDKTVAQIKDELLHGNYFVSGANSSDYGRGIYMTAFQLTTQRYSNEKNDVLELGLDKKAKLLVDDDLMDYTKYLQIPSADRADRNLDILAILSGYDGVKSKINSVEVNIINRGMLQWKNSK